MVVSNNINSIPEVQNTVQIDCFQKLHTANYTSILSDFWDSIWLNLLSWLHLITVLQFANHQLKISNRSKRVLKYSSVNRIFLSSDPPPRVFTVVLLDLNPRNVNALESFVYLNLKKLLFYNFKTCFEQNNT